MKEKYASVLSRYLPEPAVEQIVEWIIQYGFHLTITRDRSTKLGDFRPIPGKTRGHKISINFNLNPYAFLITLVHEIAHLTNWNQFGSRVKPHGKEWKAHYNLHMKPFLREDIFPKEMLETLQAYMDNPAASSCGDPDLMKKLRLYDDGDPAIFLEELPENTLFRLRSGRVFKKGPKQRKNFRCEELETHKVYLVHPLAEVEILTDAE